MDLRSSDRALQDRLNEFCSMLRGWCDQRAALRAMRENLREMLSQVEDALRYTEDRLRDAEQQLAARSYTLNEEELELYGRGPVNKPGDVAEELPSEEMSPAEASTEVPPTSDVENMGE